MEQQTKIREQKGGELIATYSISLYRATENCWLCDRCKLKVLCLKYHVSRDEIKSIFGVDCYEDEYGYFA